MTVRVNQEFFFTLPAAVGIPGDKLIRRQANKVGNPPHLFSTKRGLEPDAANAATETFEHQSPILSFISNERLLSIASLRF